MYLLRHFLVFYHLYVLYISNPANLINSYLSSQHLHRLHSDQRKSKFSDIFIDDAPIIASSIQLSMVSAKHAFNPFTTRNKNTNVKWYESDLDSFYAFVEQQPLLTAAQEVQYGRALQRWIQVEQIREKLRIQLQLVDTTSTSTSTYDDTLTHVDTNDSDHIKNKILTDEELADAVGCSTTTLQKMAKYAEISKARLVNSNLKLVLAVVSRYRTSAIPNSELIAEGTRGLARAVIRFDHRKGFRFATYATWYVHQAVSEYVRWRKHPAKMPSRYLLLLRKVKQYSTEYKEENGVLPNVNTMAAALGQSHFDVIKVLSMQTYPSLLRSAVRFKDNTKSMEGKDRTLEDVLPSIYQAPLAFTDKNDLRREMEKMMQSNLSDVERDILRLRLGLDDGRVKPIKEVGRKFKISWKQVRSVEKEALSKLLVSSEITEFVDSYHSV